MFLRTERLFLRPCWPEDRDELLALGAGETVQCHPAPGEPATRSYPRFLVTRPGGDGARIVGTAALRPGAGEARLSVWIAAPYRRKGYAAETARALGPLARTLGHRRLSTGCEVCGEADPEDCRKLAA